jgi:thiol-disulfide isomerase/thioredoxin
MHDTAPARLLHALLHGTTWALLCLVMGPLSAVDLSAPVDVPDDIGLGERLALVAWLGERQIPVPDANDLPALRLAYLERAHPERLVDADAQAKDHLRGELAAELYRKHGINPPTGSDAKAITALIARLDATAAEGLARDQAAARADSLVPDRAPARTTPEAAPGVPPETPPAEAPPLPARASADPERDARRAAVGIAVGKPFPELSGRTLDGSSFSLAQWKGKVVLVDFWASWCGPCMQEMPNVKAAYEAHHQRGFEIIGISLDQDPAALKQTITVMGLAWPQLFDGKVWKSAYAQQCAVRSIPGMFLIGKDGSLIASDLRGGDLAAAVAKAMGP